MTGPAESIGKGGIPHINAAPQGYKLFGIPVKVDPAMPDGILEFRDPRDGRTLARYDLATGAQEYITPQGVIVDGTGAVVGTLEGRLRNPAHPPLRDPVGAVRDAPEDAARVVARARILSGSMSEGDRERLREAIEDFDRAVAEVRASRTEARPPEQEG